MLEVVVVTVGEPVSVEGEGVWEGGECVSMVEGGRGEHVGGGGNVVGENPA